FTLYGAHRDLPPSLLRQRQMCLRDSGATPNQWLFLYQLEQFLAERKSADPETSYTAKLYASGTKRIAQKVGEEGVETALAATVHDRFELTNEASDLMYHLLVLLQDQDLDLTTVIENLRKRHQ
ncbi:phosphoribosyl-ATP diphosphatase, partial [Escherichia coli]|uniref:phosphoribosyl-ATP diphosphatase n=1 Tax=Escherichia coli TaxID=562 RepID=UPI00384DF009